MNSSRRVCVLISGGIDSAILMAEMLQKGCVVYPLYIRSGFYWEKAELYWLKRYMSVQKSPRLKPLTVAHVSMDTILGRHWSLNGRDVPKALGSWDSVYLPGRNLILLGQAGVFSGLNKIPLIACGVLKGNPFSDATPLFRKSMERTLQIGLGSKISIIAPYSRLAKAQVVKRFKGLPLHLTFSCLKPLGMRHCGKCSKCEERRRVVDY